MCAQLNQEPDPTKMPLEYSDFPEVVQVAFFVYGLLPQIYAPSGVFIGRDFSNIGYFLDLYEIDKKFCIEFLKYYDSLIVKASEEAALEEQKKLEAKNKSGGKNYAHRVQG